MTRLTWGLLQNLDMYMSCKSDKIQKDIKQIIENTKRQNTKRQNTNMTKFKKKTYKCDKIQI